MTLSDSGPAPAPEERPPRLPERFTLGQRLGAGGFGVVYEAYDAYRAGLIALKVLRSQAPERILHFKHEFRALTDLVHPNLVALYELFALDEVWAFSMERIQGTHFQTFVAGPAEVRRALPVTVTQGLPNGAASLFGSVSPPVRETRPLTPERVTRLRHALPQLAEALEALHAAGRLHCDLKPSNVMVDTTGRVVLVDFGLVRELGRPGTGSARAAFGTPPYVAPEQAAGFLPTPASDWYAFGVMLFEALTSVRPFEGIRGGVVEAKQRFEAPPPSTLVEGVPRELDALCTALLKPQPEARFTGEEVLRALGVRAPSPRPAPRESLEEPFVGRESSLRELEEAWEEALRGGPTKVRITGASGVGKSTLLTHFLRKLRARCPELIALEGRCYEQETIPYKALDGCVDGLVHHLTGLAPELVQEVLGVEGALLARVFPVLGAFASPEPHETAALGFAPEELRGRVLRAFRHLLERLSAERPLVLLVDDWHWADPDSAHVLEGALQKPLRLLFIVCERPEEPTPELSAALEGARRILLRELAPEESDTLARKLLAQMGEAVSSRAEALSRESGGLPLLLYELVRSGMDVHGPAPSLEALVDRRVEALSPPARVELELVAVAGRPLPLDILRAASSAPLDEAGVTSLRAQRLWRTRELHQRPSVEAFHDRVRRAVLSRLTPAQLRDHHCLLASTWERSGRGDPELLAFHWEGAGELARAAEHARHAALHATEVFAFEHAVQLRRLVLRLEGRPTGDSRRALAEALARAARGEEAAAEFAALASAAPAAEARELHGLAAAQLLRGGNVGQGLKAFRRSVEPLGIRIPWTSLGALAALLALRALALARLRWPSAVRAPGSPRDLKGRRRMEACGTLAQTLATLDPIRSALFHTRHMLLALELGDAKELAYALGREAAYSAAFGAHNHSRTARWASMAISAGRESGDADAVAFATSMEGVVALAEGRFRLARERLGEADRLYREHRPGALFERGVIRQFSWNTLYHLGELRALFAERNEAREELTTLLESALDRRDFQHVAALRFQRTHRALLVDDAPEAAREELRQARALWPSSGQVAPEAFIRIVEAEVALYADEPRQAWEALRGTWRSLSGVLLLRVQHLRVNFCYRRAQGAIALARTLRPGTWARARLLASAARDGRHLGQEGVPWARSLGKLVRAAVALLKGDVQGGQRLLEMAEEELRGLDLKMHAAATRAWRGALQGGDAGRALLEEAHRAIRDEGVRNPEAFSRLFVPWVEARSLLKPAACAVPPARGASV